MRVYVSRPLADRLLEKVAAGWGGCWHWTASLNPKGYGQIQADGRCKLAHRAAYELWKGDVPNGYTVDHLCRNRACVNPDHLEAVPHRINLLRGNTVTARHASKTHCPQGHPYAGDNLITTQRKGGGQRRVCRTCRDARNAARYP